MIPVLKVNNKKEKKTVDVDGTLTEVEVPAAKQFTMFTREGEQLQISQYGERLVGTILAIRFMLKSKHGVAPQYQSTEFDYTPEGKNLAIFVQGEGNNKKTFEGTPEEARAAFSTGEKNKFGKDMTNYDTFCHVYLLDSKTETPERTIVKLKWKLSKFCNVFDYLKSFNGGSPSTKQTIFELTQENVGDNTFWATQAVAGKDEEDIALVAEKIEELKVLLTKKPKTAVQPPTDSNDEIPVEDIPF